MCVATGHSGRVRSAVPKDMPHQEKPRLLPYADAPTLSYFFSRLFFPPSPSSSFSFFLFWSLPIRRGLHHIATIPDTARAQTKRKKRIACKQASAHVHKIINGASCKRHKVMLR